MKVLLVAALLLVGCDSGGYVTRDEAAQAFSERDKALMAIGQAVSELQKRPLVLTEKGKKKK